MPKQTVHGAQSWGSPSVGHFPLASRKCYVEKMPSEMVVEKRGGESAVKINCPTMVSKHRSADPGAVDACGVLCCWPACS